MPEGSAKVGTCLRVYDKPPDYQDEMGGRAEIEVSRSGPLAAIDQVENPFAKFCIYQFPPHINQGRFGCFIRAIREKGVKRAVALLSTDKSLAAEFQAILDQCPAAWWDPTSGLGRAPLGAGTLPIDWNDLAWTRAECV